MWADIILGIDLQAGYVKLRLGEQVPQQRREGGDGEGRKQAFRHAETLVMPAAGLMSMIDLVDRLRADEKLKPLFERLAQAKAEDQEAVSVD